MNPTRWRSALATLVGLALLATPAPAAAEYLVPPSNSAATQYTESIPTAGGRRDAERDDAKGSERTPRDVLGPGATRELNEQGPAGREVAELTAETAPPTSAEGDDSFGTASAGGAGGGGTGPNERGGATGGGAGAGEPSGSSGLGEAIEQATGVSSSGELGPLLPLLILATLAWAIWFALRSRRHDDPDPSAS